jgi:isocitrate dehydrogenase (NAD+)
MRKNYKIGIIPGDGIGRDVIKASMIVLEAVNRVASSFSLTFYKMDVGETAYAKYGNPFPEETVSGIFQMDAVLFGAVGNPHTSLVLTGFRRGFDLYAKVCPVKSLPGSKALRPATDFIIVRENTEGLFRKVGYTDGKYHVNLRVFTQKGMERIIRFAFNLARRENRKKVTLTHKAHTLSFTDGPFLKLFYTLAGDYPDILAEDTTIDSCAMHLVLKPEKFDVLIAENANGDILADLGAALIGGLGFAPSGNIGDKIAVFEPIHGTAPKYADKNVANPIAAILSAKMMLRHLGEIEAADCLERSIVAVLKEKKGCTYDLGGSASTTDMAEAISEKFLNTGEANNI